MQFVARNVAKEELDCTSATVARDVAKKLHCVSGPLITKTSCTVLCLFPEAELHEWGQY